MDKDVKKLRDDFIAKGGKAEDFDAGRNAALKKADEIRKKISKQTEKEVKDLEDKGYTRGDAKMKVSAAKIKDAEARGFGKSSRIR
jgi:hypothetical protein